MAGHKKLENEDEKPHDLEVCEVSHSTQYSSTQYTVHSTQYTLFDFFCSPTDMVCLRMLIERQVRNLSPTICAQEKLSIFYGS